MSKLQYPQLMDKTKMILIILILPTVYAKIAIDIFATDANHNVRLSGGDANLITATEQKTFNLTEDRLTELVSNYFGATPDSVHLGDPTTWGDLYTTMNWQPIKRIVKPKTATITTKSEPVLVLAKEFNSTTTELKQYITNTLTTKWSSRNLEVQDIIYHIDSKTPDPYLSLTGKWGESLERYFPMTVSSQIDVKFPKQVHAELVVTKEEVVVKVDYEASLSGHVVANFDKLFRGHKFWSVDVNTLFASKLNVTEVIEFVQYIDGKVILRDAATREVLYTAPLKAW